MSKTNAKISTDENNDNYVDIMLKLIHCTEKNDENETNPKASNSWEWRHTLRHILKKDIL